ncbi:MAG: adenosylcobinamide-GDP ribazoletransferase [Prochlorococcus sp.]
MSLPPPVWLRDLAGAWIFYSVLPGWPWPQPRFERIARFAPWIGVVIGAMQAGLWLWLASLGWNPVALALLLVAFGAWITGGLHLDGLMDSADGLAAGRARCLEAMEDSRVGASGVQALLLVVLIQLAALIRLDGMAPLALMIAGFWSRCAPLWAIARFPYLRQRDGTASFHCRHGRGLWDCLPAALVLLSALLVVLSLPLPESHKLVLLAGIGCGVIPTLVVPQWLGIRLGGHSGDSYGASMVLTETITLLLLSLLWQGSTG